MKTLKKGVAWLLCILLLVSHIPQVWASDSDVITISNAEELIRFAKNCTYDRFSIGKTVILTNNIDLESSEFTPIPIFGGTFDGGGYTISGLYLSGKETYQGLFRYIQSGATVRNLKIEGIIKPSGEKSFIGGIAGKNEGTIEKCSFAGVVNGTDSVGGIAGINSTSGIIMGSTVSGGIYGESKIGGIAGSNSGTILQCTNTAQINTVIEEHQFSFESITIDDIKATNDVKEISDIGGIAGINTGIIQNSTNSNTVGYPHVGYNIGGIAGRQSGYITESSNSGLIYGRKEVGGIVGQMEPYSVLLYSPSKLNDLRTELNTLQSLMTQLTSHTKSDTDQVSKQITSVGEAIDQSRSHTESLLDQTEGLINQNIEQVNTISVTIAGALDRMTPIAQDLTDTTEAITLIFEPLERSIELFNESIGVLSDTDEAYGDVVDYLNESVGHLEDAKLLAQAGREKISDALELAQSHEDIRDIVDTIIEASQLTIEASNHLYDSIDDMRQATVEVEDLLEIAENAGGVLQESLDELSDAIVQTESASEKLSSAMSGIQALVEYLDEQPEVTFVTTDEQYQNTKELLSESLTQVSDSIDTLNTMANTTINNILDDLQAVNDQMFVVFQLLIDITESISNFDMNVSNRIEDISENDTNEQTAGKVEKSHNTGTIEGDINVGGIAGSMAVEYSFDKEDDLQVIGDKTVNFKYQTRVIIRDSENNGPVIAKKDSVGGIVGNMKFGYIRDCISSGAIKSTGGNYIGGIAGQSKGLIFSSWTKGILSGGNYVGGIVGEGYEVANCYTITQIAEGDAYVGAIAGNITEEGQVKNNFFVSQILGGIDGISYMGKAEPIEYTELQTKENLPEVFKQFTITFVADDKEIETVSLKHGDSLTSDMLPDIPTKEGYYATWQDYEAESIQTDYEIRAEYYLYIATLISETMRNDTMPVILVEGQFREEHILTAICQNETVLAETEDNMSMEQWLVTIPEDNQTEHLIRYLPPEEGEHVEIKVLQDGKWIPCKTEKDGNYITFETRENSVTFQAFISESSITSEPIIGGVLMITLIFIIACVKRRKKNSKNKSYEA